MKKTRFRTIFWLSLSSFFAIFYGWLGLKVATSSSYIVASDVRQHVFWIRRYLDQNLFPNDLIADYFESVAPLGYTTLYKTFAFWGVDPVWLSKILPIFLGLGMTWLGFFLAMQFLPLPITGFIASLLLNQVVWLNNDLPTATPRAFLYVLFPGVLYYLIKRSLFPFLGLLLLLGLFYPQYSLLTSGILFLRLLFWRKTAGKVETLGLILVFLSLIPFALDSSDFGPVVTAAQAKTMAVFSESGRTPIFRGDPWQFYIGPGRTGLIPRALLTPVTLIPALLLPVIVKFPQHFPLVPQVKNLGLLKQTAIVSVGLFILAHLMLFRLHLPSRYTNHSLKIMICLAGGIVLTILMDKAMQLAKNNQSRLQQITGLTSIAIMLILLLFYPLFLDKFPSSFYASGTSEQVYQFLIKQPKDVVVASLSNEADNIATFAQRSVLVSWRHMSPYHLNYQLAMEQRAEDLIDAQYSTSADQVIGFIDRYRISFWLLDKSWFETEYVSRNRWFKQWPDRGEQIATRLNSSQKLILPELQTSCTVLNADNHLILDAKCLKHHLQN